MWNQSSLTCLVLKDAALTESGVGETTLLLWGSFTSYKIFCQWPRLLKKSKKRFRKKHIYFIIRFLLPFKSDRNTWLPVPNDQFELCLIIIFTKFCIQNPCWLTSTKTWREIWAAITNPNWNPNLTLSQTDWCQKPVWINEGRCLQV